jgi:choline kinase
MNVVITMAGLGERLKSSFPNVPKWKIVCNKKTLLEWSVDCLPLHSGDHLIFIGLKSDDDLYSLEEYVNNKYSSMIRTSVMLLNEPTKGQAETAWLSKSLVNSNESLMIHNIDTYFESSTILSVIRNSGADCVLGSFLSDSDNYSYAQVEDSKVIRTAEKKVISKNALTGMCYFAEAGVFYGLAERALEVHQREEIYIAPLLNNIIDDGAKIVLDYCSSCYPLGTPREIENFMASDIVTGA